MATLSTGINSRVRREVLYAQRWNVPWMPGNKEIRTKYGEGKKRLRLSLNSVFSLRGICESDWGLIVSVNRQVLCSEKDHRKRARVWYLCERGDDRETENGSRFRRRPSDIWHVWFSSFFKSVVSPAWRRKYSSVLSFDSAIPNSAQQRAAVSAWVCAGVIFFLFFSFLLSCVHARAMFGRKGWSWLKFNSGRKGERGGGLVTCFTTELLWVRSEREMSNSETVASAILKELSTAVPCP